jgi:hypothetical protein
VGAVVICDAATIIVIDTTYGDWRCDDIFGEVGGQSVITRRHVPLLDLGDEAIGVAPEAGIDEPFHSRGGQGLTQHGQDMPLPVLVERLIGQIVQMHPAFLVCIPAAAGGDEV